MSTENAPRSAARPGADYGDEDYEASRDADRSHEVDVPRLYTVVVRRGSDGVYSARLDCEAVVGRSSVSARAAILDLIQSAPAEAFHD